MCFSCMPAVNQVLFGQGDPGRLVTSEDLRPRVGEPRLLTNESKVTLQLVLQRVRHPPSRIDSSKTINNLSLELKDQVCDLPEKL